MYPNVQILLMLAEFILPVQILLMLAEFILPPPFSVQCAELRYMLDVHAE